MSRAPGRSWRHVTVVAIFSVCVAAPAIVRAHTGGTTGYASIDIRGNVVRYSLTLPSTGLPSEIVDDLNRARAGQERSRRRLLDLIGRHIHFDGGTMACEPGPGFLTGGAADVDRVTFVVDYACPAHMRELTVRDDMFDVLGADHHTLARIDAGGHTTQFAFAPESRQTRVTLADTAATTGQASFVWLGIEHILTGWDHLLFLLGLLLCGGGWLGLTKIITAFTLAHSVTLALAVLDVVTLPDRLVEAVIALSIAFVAAENLFGKPVITRRWLVSFCFGLVHGFGFSSALRELGLPSSGLMLSLFGFNVGVELGQGVVVAVALPALFMLRRTRWERRMVWSSSLAILLIGMVLFVERAFF